MNKIPLDIVGLSYSQTQSGAYALVLGEKDGKKRRLPIIIGGFEAQAIAIELEKMTPSRPLTHDLFKTFVETFNIKINEIIIYNLVEGIFFAKLVCTDGKDEVEIDARTSDAIALAVRFNCPIYTFEFILSSSGILMDDEGEVKPESGSAEFVTEAAAEQSSSPMNLTGYTTNELETMLQSAIENEEYEQASKIRDEINARM